MPYGEGASRQAADFFPLFTEHRPLVVRLGDSQTEGTAYAAKQTTNSQVAGYVALVGGIGDDRRDSATCTSKDATNRLIAADVAAIGDIRCAGAIGWLGPPTNNSPNEGVTIDGTTVGDAICPG